MGFAEGWCHSGNNCNQPAQHTLCWFLDNTDTAHPHHMLITGSAVEFHAWDWVPLFSFCPWRCLHSCSITHSTKYDSNSSGSVTTSYVFGCLIWFSLLTSKNISCCSIQDNLLIPGTHKMPSPFRFPLACFCPAPTTTYKATSKAVELGSKAINSNKMPGCRSEMCNVCAI